jgi:hypothetical protein
MLRSHGLHRQDRSPHRSRVDIARGARTSESLGADRDKRARDFDRIARTTPERAARTILRGVDRNSARILIGVDAYVLDAIPRVLGARYEGIAARGTRALGARLGIDLNR